MLVAAFLILFLSAGGRFIIGVMVKPMASEFGWTRGEISSAIFLNMAVYALAVLVTGRLYDRYGPKWVIAGSTVLVVAGYALMATMTSLWQFLLYFGVLAGAGFGGTTLPIFGSIIGNWFERRRGLAVSLAFAGSCLGQFFLIPVFSNTIVISGWRTTTVWIAALSLVVNLALVLGVIRGDPPLFGLTAYARRDMERPQQAPPGALDQTPQEARPVPRSVPSVAAHDLTLSEAMRTGSFWLFTAAMFICGGGDYLVTTHLVPMVTDHGISTATAANMLAWLGLLSLGGILLAGPACDAIGNKIPIAITFILRAMLFVFVLEFKGSIPFWIFSLGFGLTLAVTAPLTPTLVGTLYGVTHIGFISGFIATVHMIGGGMWAYLGGVIFDRTNSYDLAFLISAGVSVVALICTVLIREERHTCALALHGPVLGP